MEAKQAAEDAVISEAMRILINRRWAKMDRAQRSEFCKYVRRKGMENKRSRAKLSLDTYGE